MISIGKLYLREVIITMNGPFNSSHFGVWNYELES